MESEKLKSSPSTEEIKADVAKAVKKELSKFAPTPAENRRMIGISLFYICIALFVGVPVWLKTTATYQAPLPFKEINVLYSKPVEIHLPVLVLSLSEAVGLKELASVEFALHHSDNMRCGSGLSSRMLRLSCSVRTQSMGKSNVVNHLATASSTFTMFSTKLEESLFNTTPDGKGLSLCTSDHKAICSESSSVYSFILLPEELRSRWTEIGTSTEIISKSTHRNLVYLFVSAEAQQGEKLAKTIGNVIESKLLSTATLQNTDTDQPDDHQTGELSVSSTRATHLPPSTVYDMTVTILTHSSTEPNVSTLDAAEWTSQLLADPTMWLKAHVADSFTPWLPHVQFVFHSQRLHAVDVEQLVNSRVAKNQSYRYYNRDDLSNLVNHLESYLGAPQTASGRSKDLGSTKPGLHLILLVSTQSSECPPQLRFRLPSPYASQAMVLTNVATVPQWGGLFSIDAACHKSTAGLSQVTSQQVGGQIVAVIRALLGLSRDQTMDVTLAHWELDSWFLHRTVESLFSIRSTMKALVNLLARFPNMVINDFVAVEVAQAVREWSELLSDLKAPNASLLHFGQSFTKAQAALESINSAFFDHTLLGRLYFQDDQKFGIYVPLFVPIGMALLVSVKAMYKIMQSE